MNGFRICRASLVAPLGMILTAAVAFAQAEPTKNYTSIDAERGKPVRIGYHASADTKSCTAVEPPSVKVIDAPDFGALAVQTGKLSTEKISGCSRITIPVRVLFYTPNQSSAESDHVVYETTSADGKVATYDITIKIKEKAAPKRAPTLEQKI